MHDDIKNNSIHNENQNLDELNKLSQKKPKSKKVNDKKKKIRKKRKNMKKKTKKKVLVTIQKKKRKSIFQKYTNPKFEKKTCPIPKS